MKIALSIGCLLSAMMIHTAKAQTDATSQTRQLIDSLYVVDQQVQQDIMNEKVDSVRRGLFQVQFDTFNRHKPYLTSIVDQYGFPGYDLVGKETSDHFFVLVQHCDDDLAFQQRVLALMQPQVDKRNADTQGFAYLTDRVLVNSNDLQLYGTQLTYQDGRAICQGVRCVAELDERRAKVGLGPINDYLQRATQMHRAMNSRR